MTWLQGKVSWFGGPNDPGAQGVPASGISITHPGIAVYNRDTLGGWWLVRLPNGKSAVLQQTDIGPAPSTGRKVDITYSALPELGYTQNDFPTDATVSAVYLGKTKPGKTGVISQLAGGDLARSAIINSTVGDNAPGGILGIGDHSFKYAGVWIGALTLAVYMLWTGVDRGTHGSLTRTRNTATKAAVAAA